MVDLRNCTTKWVSKFGCKKERDSMSPRPGLDREKVLSAAAELVDREGRESLTVARLAAHLQVRPPSLYNHMRSLEQLEQDLAVRGLTELAVRLRTAATGLAELDALTAMANAYRTHAAQHPGLYAMALRAREVSTDYSVAGAEIIAVVRAVLVGYALSDEEVLHAARCLRSAVHGFVSLEASGGFGMPFDLDESFSRLIQILHQGMRRS
jgi:AcrR family transcriptional regulator